MHQKWISLLLAGILLLSVFSCQVFAASVPDKRIPEDAFFFNGHYYKVYTNECRTWEDAKEFCEEMNGYLAVISSQEENDALYQYITSNGIQTAYFGLSNKENPDEWKWVEQEVSDYLNWYPTEPNQEPGEHYAEFYWKFTDGTWNDGNFKRGTSSDSRAFLCEWDPAIMPALPAFTLPIWPFLLGLLLAAGGVLLLLKKKGLFDQKTTHYGNPEFIQKTRK